MSDPAQVYAEIRRSITDQFVYRVSGVMLYHRGEDAAISKEDIAAELGCQYSSGVKRKLELAFERLCEMNFPVMATSGVAGYFMPVTADEFDRWKAEHQSRLDSETNKIALIERMKQRHLAGDTARAVIPVEQMRWC